MQKIVILAVFIVISIVISYYLGRNRQIGFRWSLFFCIFLNPVIGLIITLLSRKYYKAKPSKGKKIFGQVLAIPFSLFLIPAIFGIINEPNGNFYLANIQLLSFSLGMIGLGFYLMELGKGKILNQGVPGNSK